jgi:hypothetical protein
MFPARPEAPIRNVGVLNLLLEIENIEFTLPLEGRANFRTWILDYPRHLREPAVGDRRIAKPGLSPGFRETAYPDLLAWQDIYGNVSFPEPGHYCNDQPES